MISLGTSGGGSRTGAYSRIALADDNLDHSEEQPSPRKKTPPRFLSRSFTDKKDQSDKKQQNQFDSPSRSRWGFKGKSGGPGPDSGASTSAGGGDTGRSPSPLSGGPAPSTGAAAAASGPATGAAFAFDTRADAAEAANDAAGAVGGAGKGQVPCKSPKTGGIFGKALRTFSNAGSGKDWGSQKAKKSASQEAGGSGSGEGGGGREVARSSSAFDPRGAQVVAAPVRTTSNGAAAAAAVAATAAGHEGSALAGAPVNKRGLWHARSGSSQDAILWQNGGKLELRASSSGSGGGSRERSPGPPPRPISPLGAGTRGGSALGSAGASAQAQQLLSLPPTIPNYIGAEAQLDLLTPPDMNPSIDLTKRPLSADHGGRFSSPSSGPNSTARREQRQLQKSASSRQNMSTEEIIKMWSEKQSGRSPGSASSMAAAAAVAVAADANPRGSGEGVRAPSPGHAAGAGSGADADSDDSSEGEGEEGGGGGEGRDKRRDKKKSHRRKEGKGSSSAGESAEALREKLEKIETKLSHLRHKRALYAEKLQRAHQRKEKVAGPIQQWLKPPTRPYDAP